MWGVEDELRRGHITGGVPEKHPGGSIRREVRCFDPIILTLTHKALPVCYTNALSPMILRKKMQVPLTFSIFYVQLLVDS